MVKVVGLVGMPASGKSTVANMFVEQGYHKIHLGDYIWMMIAKAGKRKTREAGSKMGLKVHSNPKAFHRWVDKQIKEINAKYLLIDSLRDMHLYNHLRKKFGKRFLVVCPVVGKETRFKREHNRARLDKYISRKDFLDRDNAEIKMGVSEVIARSDYYLDADFPFKTFKKSSISLARKLKRA